MSDFPSFLASQDDLEAHVADSFSGLPSVEKGTRFATFASRLVCLLPEFREFGEARLSQKLSHDGGVDIESDQLDDGRRLCAQAKLSLSGKDDIDSIISKFHDFEQSVSTGPSQGDLLADKAAYTKPVFGILSLSRLEGILRRYKASSSATRAYYDRLIEEQRLHVIDGARILKTLQNAYARTFGIPSGLKVRSQAGWIRHGSARFGVMTASDLAALYHEHGDGLFFENIRTFLGPTSGQVAPDQPTVNEEISTTIRTSPERFLERIAIGQLWRPAAVRSRRSLAPRGSCRRRGALDRKAFDMGTPTPIRLRPVRQQIVRAAAHCGTPIRPASLERACEFRYDVHEKVG